MARRRRKQPERLKTLVDQVAHAQATFDRWFARMLRAITMMDKCRKRIKRLTSAPKPKSKRKEKPDGASS